MNSAAESAKRNIITENPLFVTILGMSGAIVFTRDILSAVSATITVLVVLISAMSAKFIFERYVGTSGAKAVFFTAAVTATTVCGTVTALTLPDLWKEIGACYPLFPAGSLAMVTSCRSDDTLRKRMVEIVTFVLGYGAALFIVSVIRQLLACIPFMGTPGGALITMGIIAAVFCAVKDKLVALSSKVAAKLSQYASLIAAKIKGKAAADEKNPAENKDQDADELSANGAADEGSLTSGDSEGIDEPSSDSDAEAAE